MICTSYKQLGLLVKGKGLEIYLYDLVGCIDIFEWILRSKFRVYWIANFCFQLLLIQRTDC